MQASYLSPASPSSHHPMMGCCAVSSSPFSVCCRLFSFSWNPFWRRWERIPSICPSPPQRLRRWGRFLPPLLLPPLPRWASHSSSTIIRPFLLCLLKKMTLARSPIHPRTPRRCHPGASAWLSCGWDAIRRKGLDKPRACWWLGNSKLLCPSQLDRV